MKILIATKNQGKMKEIRRIFQATPYELVDLTEVDGLADIKVCENAKSFEGNALIKAIIFGRQSGLLTLADDSGICVDALSGQPGVLSARYSGGGDQENNQKLLNELKDVPEINRDCHYECHVAIYDPKTNWVETVNGHWDGRVAFEPRGNKSFGYAPIFLPKDYDYKLTNAELDEDDKININHRGQAFSKALAILGERFNH